MEQTRRGFLKLIGLATAAVAVAPLVELEPERRIWAVPSNAPVGSRLERSMTGMETMMRYHAEQPPQKVYWSQPDEAFDEYVSTLMRNAKRAFDQRIETSLLYGRDSGEFFGINAASNPLWHAPTYSGGDLTWAQLQQALKKEGMA